MHNGKYLCHKVASSTYNLPASMFWLLNLSNTKKAKTKNEKCWKFAWGKGQ